MTIRIGAVVLILFTACTQSLPAPKNLWDASIMQASRQQGLLMAAQIRAAAQPADAKALLGPACKLLIRAQLYKEARNLATLAINTFPKDPIYRHFLAQTYQAMIDAGQGGRRTQKKRDHELKMEALLQSTIQK